MKANLSRRGFLAGAAALASAAPGFSQDALAPNAGLSFPLVDFHVHLNTLTLEQVLAASAERRVKYGILEHAGTKDNDYPIVLADDAALQAWIARLQGKGVYIGVQAEWFDWMPCFSRDVFTPARLRTLGLDDRPRRQRQAHQGLRQGLRPG